MQILRDFYGGEPTGFLVTYVAFGLVALLLAAVYSVGGTWGTLAFALPLFLARQVFLYSRRARDMAEMIAEKTRVLLAVSERIAEERRDERLTIAAGIHDEVLPPLYKVHLMGQVIRRDLDSGQLLALEDDIPDLLRAADSANDAMRLLIRDLRHSPLGPGGLEETLRLLVSHLQHDAAPRIHLELSAIAGSPVVQLLAYQVAREAIKNAIRHASAANIWIRVGVQDTDLRVVVEDDGVGFDPPEVDRDNHFGLQIMRERVELAGGVFLVVSRPAAGCQVVARFPSEMSR